MEDIRLMETHKEIARIVFDVTGETIEDGEILLIALEKILRALEHLDSR